MILKKSHKFILDIFLPLNFSLWNFSNHLFPFLLLVRLAPIVVAYFQDHSFLEKTIVALPVAAGVYHLQDSILTEMLQSVAVDVPNLWLLHCTDLQEPLLFYRKWNKHHWVLTVALDIEYLDFQIIQLQWIRRETRPHNAAVENCWNCIEVEHRHFELWADFHCTAIEIGPAVVVGVAVAVAGNCYHLPPKHSSPQRPQTERSCCIHVIHLFCVFGCHHPG
jgi:hypothetical protein